MKPYALSTAEEFLQPICRDGENVLAAVSGGLDSMCLLHFLQNRTLTHGGKVYAAHFNHHLRGDSANRDAAFVREYCQASAIAFIYGEADVSTWAAQQGVGIETAARERRYEFLYAAREQSDCRYILTAHHANDNAETILLNWIRGTGSRGLSGIPAISDITTANAEKNHKDISVQDSKSRGYQSVEGSSAGKILRPFLRLTRAELEAYAREYHIPHVEDETNAEPDVTPRNFIRRDILPLLEKINPQAIKHIARTAVLLAEDSAALENLGRQAVMMSVYARPEHSASTSPEPVCSVSARSERDIMSEWALDWAKFSRWPHAVQARGLLQLLAEIAGQRKNLTERHIRAILSLPVGGMLSLPYQIQVRRERQTLIVQRLSSKASDSSPVQTGQSLRSSGVLPVAIQPGQTLTLGGWSVTLTALTIEHENRPFSDGSGLHQHTENSQTEQYIYILKIPNHVRLSLSYWRRDDRMTLPGSPGARSLKRLCVDNHIPPWVRDTLPILRVEECPAAVPRIGVHQAFAVVGRQSDLTEPIGKANQGAVLSPSVRTAPDSQPETYEPARLYQIIFSRQG